MGKRVAEVESVVRRSVPSLRVVEGDALVRMRELPSASVDVVLVDPPYSSGATREAGKCRGGAERMTVGGKRRADGSDKVWFPTDSLSTDGLRYFVRECALEWRRLVRDGGHVLVFIDWRMEETVRDAITHAVETADLHRKNLIVWDKLHNAMGWHFRTRHELVLHYTVGTASGREAARHDVGNVIPCVAVPFKRRRHPTEKPVPLLRTLLSVVAFPGDVVLDPFCGSGSTGEACAAEGLSFVGIDSSFADVARERVATAAAMRALGMPFPPRAC